MSVSVHHSMNNRVARQEWCMMTFFQSFHVSLASNSINATYQILLPYLMPLLLLPMFVLKQVAHTLDVCRRLKYYLVTMPRLLLTILFERRCTLPDTWILIKLNFAERQHKKTVNFTHPQYFIHFLPVLVVKPMFCVETGEEALYSNVRKKP